MQCLSRMTKFFHLTETLLYFVIDLNSFLYIKFFIRVLFFLNLIVNKVKVTGDLNRMIF